MFANKVALVTGAGGGIGAATAQLFARHGARVAVVDRDGVAAERVADELTSAGSIALALQADVANSAEVDSVVERVLEAFGGIDCAVNNAGIQGPAQLLTDYSDEQWRQVLDVNLNGVFYCMRAEIRAMLASRGGAIVNVSSVAAVTPIPVIPAYVASKSAVLGLTRSAAGQYAAHDIRINSVVPGRTLTPLMRTAIEQAGLEDPETTRYGDVTELAEAIVWLCAPQASYVHGASLIVDGGESSYSDGGLIGTRALQERRSVQR